MTFDTDHAGGVVELLGDIFADALELAAAAAGGGVRLVMNLGTRQVRRKRCALGRALLRVRGGRRRTREFFLDFGDVGGTGFVEQADLFGRERFAAATECPAPVQGQFCSQFVDLALTPVQFGGLAGDDAVAVTDLGDQGVRECAQLLGIEDGQIGISDHPCRMARATPRHCGKQGSPGLGVRD